MIFVPFLFFLKNERKKAIYTFLYTESTKVREKQNELLGMFWKMESALEECEKVSELL